MKGFQVFIIEYDPKINVDAIMDKVLVFPVIQYTS